jgi:hypothetical protein
MASLSSQSTPSLYKNKFDQSESEYSFNSLKTDKSKEDSLKSGDLK